MKTPTYKIKKTPQDSQPICFHPVGVLSLFLHVILMESNYEVAKTSLSGDTRGRQPTDNVLLFHSSIDHLNYFQTSMGHMTWFI